jgi:hypothetical protein
MGGHGDSSRGLHDYGDMRTLTDMNDESPKPMSTVKPQKGLIFMRRAPWGVGDRGWADYTISVGRLPLGTLAATSGVT